MNRRTFLSAAGLLVAPLAFTGQEMSPRRKTRRESRWRKGPWTLMPNSHMERVWSRTFYVVNASQLQVQLDNVRSVNLTEYEDAPAEALIVALLEWEGARGSLVVNLRQRLDGWRIHIAIPTVGGGLYRTDKLMVYAFMEFRSLFPTMGSNL